MSAVSPSALVAKGHALKNAGSLEAALAAFRAALAANPGLSSAQIMIAVTLLDQGKARQALAAAMDALKLAPNSASALRVRAVALGACGRLSRAEKAAEEAIRANPAHSAGHRLLGEILVRRKKFARAEAALRRALEISPADILALVSLGLMLARRGRVAEADEMAERCKGLGSDHLGVLVLRGQLALLKGRADEAQDFALWALSRNARYRPALSLLFSAHARRSPFLGLWWRIASRADRYPRYAPPALFGALMSLLGVPFLYLGMSADIADHTGKIIVFAVIGYLAASQLVFRARIRRELRQVRLKKSF